MALEYRVDGDTAYLYLRNINKWTKISIKDLPQIIKHGRRWHGWYSKSAKSYYVYGYTIINEKQFALNLPRWLLEVNDPQKEIDHINHDTLDNTRVNLCVVSKCENTQNRKNFSNNISGHKGVYWSKQHKKWLVTIQHNNKRSFLGLFDNIEDATNAYENAKPFYHPYLTFCERTCGIVV
jgi:hypothetical protein